MRRRNHADRRSWREGELRLLPSLYGHCESKCRRRMYTRVSTVRYQAMMPQCVSTQENLRGGKRQATSHATHAELHPNRRILPLHQSQTTSRPYVSDVARLPAPNWVIMIISVYPAATTHMI